MSERLVVSRPSIVCSIFLRLSGPFFRCGVSAILASSLEGRFSLVSLCVIEFAVVNPVPLFFVVILRNANTSQGA